TNAPVAAAPMRNDRLVSVALCLSLSCLNPLPCRSLLMVISPATNLFWRWLSPPARARLHSPRQALKALSPRVRGASDAVTASHFKGARKHNNERPGRRSPLEHLRLTSRHRFVGT